MRPLLPGLPAVAGTVAVAGTIALAGAVAVVVTAVANPARAQAGGQGAGGLDAPSPSGEPGARRTAPERAPRRGFPESSRPGAAPPPDGGRVHTPEGYGPPKGRVPPAYPDEDTGGPARTHPDEGTGGPARWPLQTPDGQGDRAVDAVPGDAMPGDAPRPDAPRADAPDVPVREPPAPPRYRNAFTFNPIALVVGILQFQYERGIGDHVSLFLGPSFLFYDPVGGFEGSIFAVGLDLGARFVLGPGAQAPEGFWVGPEVGLLYARIEDDFGAEANAFGYSLSGLLGYTWFWGRFVFSVGGGITYVDIDADVDGDRLGYRGVEPAARLSMGVAF